MEQRVSAIAFYAVFLITGNVDMDKIVVSSVKLVVFFVILILYSTSK